MAPPGIDFRFEGEEFRIIFRHDLSRRLVDHVDHDVYLLQNSGRRGDSTPYTHGPAYLVCANCTSKHHLDRPLKLTGLSKREKQRMTFCAIAFYDNDHWVTTDFAGEAVVNTKAGDQFSRREGCRRALIDALTPWVEENGVRRRFMRGTAAFRAAARAAYESRGSRQKEAGK